MAAAAATLACDPEGCGGAAPLLGKGADGTPAAGGILLGTSDQPGGSVGGLASGALGFDGAGASRGSEPVTSMLRSSASMRANRRSRSAVSRRTCSATRRVSRSASVGRVGPTSASDRTATVVLLPSLSSRAAIRCVPVRVCAASTAKPMAIAASPAQSRNRPIIGGSPLSSSSSRTLALLRAITASSAANHATEYQTQTAAE
jgi:hypothetical protein